MELPVDPKLPLGWAEGVEKRLTLLEKAVEGLQQKPRAPPQLEDSWFADPEVQSLLDSINDDVISVASSSCGFTATPLATPALTSPPQLMSPPAIPGPSYQLSTQYSIPVDPNPNRGLPPFWPVSCL
jgi:hypothetical protein